MAGDVLVVPSVPVAVLQSQPLESALALNNSRTMVNVFRIIGRSFLSVAHAAPHGIKTIFKYNTKIDRRPESSEKFIVEADNRQQTGQPLQVLASTPTYFAASACSIFGNMP